MNSKQFETKLLSALATATVCVDLCLGLWPFHAPRNNVVWSSSGTGLEFARWGTVQRTRPTQQPAAGTAGSTVEIWVRPDRWMTSATLVALRAPGGYPITRLRQSLTDLEVSVEVHGWSRRDHASTLTVADALGPSLTNGKPVFITVTSGQAGTVVYLNGIPAQQIDSLVIPRSTMFGPLILGDSPGQPDSFRGLIGGLALYESEIDAETVKRHAQNWKSHGDPEISTGDHALALYLLDEKKGAVIRDHLGQAPPLEIPERYFVSDKIVLEPFWNEFDFSKAYWSGNFKNVVGLIPVGFCFYAYLISRFRPTKAALIAVTVGLLVSLTIELGQILLPMRDSGTTDLFTNTFGSYLGVVAYRKIFLPLASRVPWLARFALAA